MHNNPTKVQQRLKAHKSDANRKRLASLSHYIRRLLSYSNRRFRFFFPTSKKLVVFF